MSTMMAVRAHTFGAPDVLTLESIPTPVPGDGEILIRVEAASVNFADVMRRRADHYPLPTALPFTPGSEVAGVVAAHGAGVASPPLGTPVFALVGTGAAMGSTGYAQFALAPAAQVIPIPPGIDVTTASGLFVAGLTAMLILRDVAQVTAGTRVLLQGAGGAVGQYAIQIARHLGARTVIGLASTEAKRARAIAAGADAALDSRGADWPDAVRQMTDGEGVDVVLDISGGPSVEQSLHCLAPFGRVIVYGAASGTPMHLSADAILHTFYSPALNQSLQVFNLGLWFMLRSDAVAAAMQSLIGLLLEGRIAAPDMLRLPLSEASAAHRQLETRQSAGKIVLTPWSDGPVS